MIANTPIAVETTQQGWLEVLRSQVESLRFGTVQIVVHESRVVQIEKTERVRLDPAGGDGARIQGVRGRRP